MFWPVAVALTVAGPPLALTATVGQLGAASFADRESAERELRAAGDRAVRPLQAAMSLPDPEVRRRAVGLLATIEADRFDRPTRVSLFADRRPTAAVVAELAVQAGYPVEYSPSAGGPSEVSLRLDRVPFWAAVDAVREAAKLQMDIQGDGRIALCPGDESDPYVCYAGPFRLTAEEITAGQRRQLAGVSRRPAPADPDLLHLSIRLTAEPRATVVWVGPPTVQTAVDDRGASLKPDVQERTAYYPAEIGGRAVSHPIHLDTLRRRDRGGTTLHTLRGAVPVALLADTRPDVVVDDLTAAAGRTLQGRRHALTVGAVREGFRECTVELTAVPTTGPTADGWQHGLPNRLELTGTDGTAWRLSGVELQTSHENRVQVLVRFLASSDAKPARLTLVEWRTVTRDVPFEFKNIPLP